MDSSLRDFLNDMAEHGSILKNIKNMHYFLFFPKTELCSAISMKRYRRNLFNGIAQHRPILKNNQNTYPRFGFIPKTGIAFPKTGVLFLRIRRA